MSVVELHAAHVWDCDSCGKENFERAIEGDMDEACMDALEESDDIASAQMMAINAEADPDREGGMRAAVLVTRIAVVPSVVKCKHCGESFTTEIPTFEDGDDE